MERKLPDYYYNYYYYLNEPPPRWPKVLMGVVSLVFVAGLIGIIMVSVRLWQGIEEVEAQREAMQVPTPTVIPTGEKSEKEEEKEEDSSFVWENRPAVGKQFGTLSIPRIDAQIGIWEGTRDRELDLGVGHHESSVLPGEADNSVLAGHRETAFRRAKEIRKGDEIQVISKQHTFTYQVKKLWVADADDSRVVASNGNKESKLIIYTCWPVEAVFSGYAPKRYVIESELTGIEKN